MTTTQNSSNDYATLLQCENKIRLLEQFKGAKQHHKMQCMVCDHIWTATPISKRQTLKKHGVGGCPSCNTRSRNETYAISRAANLQKLRDRGIEILTPNYDGRHNSDQYTKVKVRNTMCGHVFDCSPANLLQAQVECAVCGPQKRVAPLTTWSLSNSAKWRETATEWNQYKADVARLTNASYAAHHHRINPNNLPRGKAGVEGAYHLDHIVPKRFCFDNGIPPNVCADPSNLQMIGWKENVGSRSNIKGTIPPLFLKYVQENSKYSTYVAALQRIFPNGQPYAHIGDVVATMYDAQSNRAIIVHPIDQTYANQKSAIATQKSLEDAGIKYIILFEDEMHDVALLTAKLKHYTDLNTAQRIHARDCTIKECDKRGKRELLNANHVQGNDNAPMAYGAYYNDELVAVMTFSPPRVALGQKGKKDRTGVWELSRFCTNVKYRIPGVASKLLKHFQRNQQWKEIYSYADKRWSVGNMYHQLGFKLVANNPPDYFYVINGTRKHRWNYRKDILKSTLENYDPTATEYQNMVDHGYWRVWDCGTLKFSLINDKQINNCTPNGATSEISPVI